LEKNVFFLDTIIHHMNIRTMQVLHRVIHPMQVMNQAQLMHNQEPMMDMRHQQPIPQVKDLNK
jgi:hypothetical protein